MFEKERIANLIIFLSERVESLYITKLLKLVYLIDETSVKEAGIPVSGLTYNVWQYGPVNIELYNKLSFFSNEFAEYFDVQANENGKIIKHTSEFDDSEFSEYDIEMMQFVADNYGKLSSAELVDLLHRQGSLWHKIVEEKNLEEVFKYEHENTSPFQIDFSELVKKSDYKKMIFSLYNEKLEFQQAKAM